VIIPFVRFLSEIINNWPLLIRNQNIKLQENLSGGSHVVLSGWKVGRLDGWAGVRRLVLALWNCFAKAPKNTVHCLSVALDV
jgi:hypothetical protein